MIKLEIKGNKQQTITKVCNTCGSHIENLSLENIVLTGKARKRGDNGLRPIDSNGNETRTDFFRMMDIVMDAGYSGYVGIEYEGSGMDEMSGIKATKDLLERVKSGV